jgi:hypothetical protein
MNLLVCGSDECDTALNIDPNATDKKTSRTRVEGRKAAVRLPRTISGRPRRGASASLSSNRLSCSFVSSLGRNPTSGQPASRGVFGLKPGLGNPQLQQSTHLPGCQRTRRRGARPYHCAANDPVSVNTSRSSHSTAQAIELDMDAVPTLTQEAALVVQQATSEKRFQPRFYRWDHWTLYGGGRSQIPRPGQPTETVNRALVAAMGRKPRHT